MAVGTELTLCLRLKLLVMTEVTDVVAVDHDDRVFVLVVFAWKAVVINTCVPVLVTVTVVT